VLVRKVGRGCRASGRLGPASWGLGDTGSPFSSSSSSFHLVRVRVHGATVCKDGEREAKGSSATELEARERSQGGSLNCPYPSLPPFNPVPAPARPSAQLLTAILFLLPRSASLSFVGGTFGYSPDHAMRCDPSHPPLPPTLPPSRRHPTAPLRIRVFRPLAAAPRRAIRAIRACAASFFISFLLIPSFYLRGTISLRLGGSLCATLNHSALGLMTQAARAQRPGILCSTFRFLLRGVCSLYLRAA
jgi:hypothetical protein